MESGLHVKELREQLRLSSSGRLGIDGRGNTDTRPPIPLNLTSQLERGIMLAGPISLIRLLTRSQEFSLPAPYACLPCQL